MWMPSVLIERVPQFEIRDGLVHIEFGGDQQPICMPIRTFRMAVARATKLLAEHDAAGHVVPMRKRGGHAAS